ncbi:hypothetical protein C8R45DRAFT_998806, partial [Mycena sanguinolenta]
MCLPYWHSCTTPSIRVSSSVHAPCRPAPANRYAAAPGRSCAARFGCSTRPRSASPVYPSSVVVVGSSLLQAARATSSPPLGPQPSRSLRHHHPRRLFSALTTSYAPLAPSRARLPCCLPLPASVLPQLHSPIYSLHASLVYPRGFLVPLFPCPRLSPAAAVVLASGTSRPRSMRIFPFSHIPTCSVWGSSALKRGASPEAISRPSSLRLSRIHQRRFFVLVLDCRATFFPAPSRFSLVSSCLLGHRTSPLRVSSSTFHSSLCGLSHIHRARGTYPSVHAC